jgi:NADH-quinone oxidoreductase subunit L
LPGHVFAQFALTAGVFVTALYTFRMFFLVFHGRPRASGAHAHEAPAVVWLPLVLLAVPSVLIGALAAGPMVAGNFLAGAVFVDGIAHPAPQELARDYPGALAMALEGFARLPFWLAVAGVGCAWAFYLRWTEWPARLQAALPRLYRLLDQKYYLDRINEVLFIGGARRLGGVLWQEGDVAIIDGFLVNGSARLVARLAQIVRRLQSGFIYHYAFAMLLGIAAMLFIFLTWPYLPTLTADRR